MGNRIEHARFSSLVVAAAWFAAAPSAGAHHSPAAYDRETTTTIEGRLTDVVWRNPHVYLELEAEDAYGVKRVYEVEAVGASTLTPRGVRPESFPVGEIVTVGGYASRRGTNEFMGLGLETAGGDSIPLFPNPLEDAQVEADAPAQGLDGIWFVDIMQLFRELEDLPLNVAGREMAESRPEGAPAAQSVCTPVPPPLVMFWPVLRSIEVRDDVVTIEVDTLDTRRTVYLDGRGHPDDLEPSPMGHSIGHWEDGTLVVDTVGFAENPQGINLSVSSSPAKHLVERFTLADDGRALRYEATLEDPAYLTEPVELSGEWLHRPDLELTREPCDAETARRFLLSRNAAAQAASEIGLVPVEGGYIEYVATGPENGEPVLLLHGFGLGTALKLIQDAAALDGYRVIRMHQRGYVGSSDMLDGASPVADALAVLDALGIDRAHVAGHSAGAGLALQLAVAAPERVHTLTLIDTGPLPGLGESTPARGDEAVAAAAEALAANGVEGFIEAFSEVLLGDDWREFFDAIPGGYEQAVADMSRFELVAPGGEPLEAEQITAVEQPTLVLRAEESWLADQSLALAAAMPNAESGMIEDADHALVTQKPDEVAAAIAEFAGRHPM